MAKPRQTQNDELARLVDMFEEAEQNARSTRELSLLDRDYYDNKQWTDEEVQSLKRRGQPCITINRIKPKIDFMLGLERSSRNDPKALARTPLHEQDAAAISDILRYIDASSNFDEVRSQSFKNFSIEGTAAGKVEVTPIKNQKGDVKDFDVRMRALQWDRVFWDPHAREENFRDARYKGEVIFIDADAAKALYPGNNKVIDGAFLDDAHDMTNLFDDRPLTTWVDRKRKRIRIVEIWYKKGNEVWHATITKTGFITKPKRTPFKDDMGRDEDPYVFRSAFVTRDGGRYGHVRQLISVQDEINKRRSKALHLLSVRQTRVSRNSEIDTGKLRKELARPDGVIRAENDEFEIIPTGDMAQAQFALLSDAQQQIDLVGVNAALSGKQEGSASGKALQARSASGAVEINPIFDGIRMWQRDMFKKAWNRVRDYWTEEKYVRVTDDFDSPKFLLLNRDHGEEHILRNESPDNVVEVNTPIPELDVDIVIREGLNDSMAQQEQFIELTRMAASGVQVPLDLLIEVSALRPDVKDKILQRLRPSPEAEAQQAAIQQTQLQLELEQKAADVSNTKANAAKKQAETENKQLENIIKQLKPLEDV